MQEDSARQEPELRVATAARPVDYEAVVPNPKARLLDQVREVLRLKHYSIRTERCYCDWIRRYVKFHGMRSREELGGGEAKIEQFLKNICRKCGSPISRSCWGPMTCPPP